MSSVNSRFHPSYVGCNLGLIRCFVALARQHALEVRSLTPVAFEFNLICVYRHHSTAFLSEKQSHLIRCDGLWCPIKSPGTQIWPHYWHETVMSELDWLLCASFLRGSETSSDILHFLGIYVRYILYVPQEGRWGRGKLHSWPSKIKKPSLAWFEYWFLAVEWFHAAFIIVKSKSKSLLMGYHSHLPPPWPQHGTTIRVLALLPSRYAM